MGNKYNPFPQVRFTSDGNCSMFSPCPYFNPEDLALFCLSSPAEEGSDKASLVDTSYTARVHPPLPNCFLGMLKLGLILL